MIYKISTHGINPVLLLLIAAMWLAGCVDERAITIPQEMDTVNFTVTVPDVSIPSVDTRTMTGDNNKEDAVESVDILVFDTSDSPEVFLERIVGTGFTQDLTSTNSTVTFSAKLSRTNTPVRLVLVANQSLSSSIVDGFIPGETTKVEVLETLTTSLTGEWPANGSTAGGYKPIPMYGEVSVPKIYSQMTPLKIDLTRMLARIDIQNNAPDFTVENVYLANYNTAGYIAPAWDLLGNIDETTEDLMIPSTNEKQLGEENVIDYAVNIGPGESYEGEIYTFEAHAAVDDPDNSFNDEYPDRKDAVCLIVKGNINGESYYYRVDFLEKNTAEYMPLKRNYKYVIDIREASGIGYASITEALESYRTMTNLSVRLISYDRSKISNIVYNGQYMLGVSEDKLNMRQYENTRYPINVFTNSPGGWKATITEGSWLTFVGQTYETTGDSGDDDSVMLLNIPYLRDAAGASRSETIKLTAGRLVQEITVTQTVEEPGTIRFVDAYGNVLENGLFFPMTDPDTGGDPEPQTFYVMWTTGGVGAWLHPRNDFNDGDIPMDYNEISPDIPANSDDKVSLHGGVQAITLHPRRGYPENEEYWRWDLLHFDLYDGSGTWICQEQFSVNQGELTFRIDNYPQVNNSNTYALDLGPTHTLHLVTNVNWEIESVEEIGATGLLGSTGTQHISAGTSNMINTANTPNVIITLPATNEDSNFYGTDIVAAGGHNYLNFPTGDWVYGKTGTVRVTFRNLMHTAGGNGEQDDKNIYGYGTENSDDDYFPFYRTIDLVLTAVNPFTYTVNPAGSYFGVHPQRYVWEGNAAYYPLSQAQQNCEALGTGWRIPNLSEGILASLYVENLGGFGLDNPTGWFENMRYWTTAYNSDGDGSYRLIEVPWRGSTARIDDDAAEGYPASVRCVRDLSNTGYPYVQPYSQDGNGGVMIVSRDQNGGIAQLNSDSEIFFTQGETVNETTNKMAPKLLVANENTTMPNNGNYTDAKTACADKGTGWRLPTLREVSLMISVGMVDGEKTYTNTGFERFTLPDTFTRVSYSNPIWTLTKSEEDRAYIMWGFDQGTRGMTEDYWTVARCVKSID